MSTAWETTGSEHCKRRRIALECNWGPVVSFPDCNRLLSWISLSVRKLWRATGFSVLRKQALNVHRNYLVSYTSATACSLRLSSSTLCRSAVVSTSWSRRGTETKYSKVSVILWRGVYHYPSDTFQSWTGIFQRFCALYTVPYDKSAPKPSRHVLHDTTQEV